MSFANRLKMCRESKGFSQAKVAVDNGISRRAYQYYEAGTQEPVIGVVMRLADYFQVSLDFIAGLSDDPERK